MNAAIRSVLIDVPDDDASVDQVRKFAQMLVQQGIGHGVVVMSLPLGLPEGVLPACVAKMQDFLIREATAQKLANIAKNN